MDVMELPEELRLELRRDLRNLAKSARRHDGQSETAQWQAVSSFVIAFVAAHRTSAPSTLLFRSREHQAWCDAVLEAARPNSGVEDPYQIYIARNTKFTEYVDSMCQQSLEDW